MSTAGNSYEAWKASQIESDAAGDEDWSEASSTDTWVGVSSIVEMKGVWAGMFLGVGLMLCGLATLIPSMRHLTTGTCTVGTVVGHKDFTNRRANNLVTPIVRYSAPGGVVDMVGNLSVPRSIYRPGQEVWVLYLPSDPCNAVILDFMQMFLIPSMVGGLGLICFAGTAGIMYVVVRSELRPSAPAPIRSAPMKPLPPISVPKPAEAVASVGGNS